MVDYICIQLIMSTEGKIKKAAFDIFVEKGYSETKTRDIAKVAGVNNSTLHYYYRSKDELFKQVIGEVYKEFNGFIESVFEEQVSFKEKIYLFIERYTEFCKKNPDFPVFITLEVERNPDKIFNAIDFKSIDDRVESELNQLIENGTIRPITYTDYAINITALVSYPFINRSMIMKVNELSVKDFNTLVDDRKKLVYDMIVQFLYL